MLWCGARALFRRRLARVRPLAGQATITTATAAKVAAAIAIAGAWRPRVCLRMCLLLLVNAIEQVEQENVGVHFVDLRVDGERGVEHQGACAWRETRNVHSGRTSALTSASTCTHGQCRLAPRDGSRSRFLLQRRVSATVSARRASATIRVRGIRDRLMRGGHQTRYAERVCARQLFGHTRVAIETVAAARARQQVEHAVERNV